MRWRVVGVGSVVKDGEEDKADEDGSSDEGGESDVAGAGGTCPQAVLLLTWVGELSAIWQGGDGAGLGLLAVGKLGLGPV